MGNLGKFSAVYACLLIAVPALAEEASRAPAVDGKAITLHSEVKMNLGADPKAKMIEDSASAKVPTDVLFSRPDLYAAQVKDDFEKMIDRVKEQFAAEGKNPASLTAADNAWKEITAGRKPTYKIVVNKDTQTLAVYKVNFKRVAVEDKTSAPLLVSEEVIKTCRVSTGSNGPKKGAGGRDFVGYTNEGLFRVTDVDKDYKSKTFAGHAMPNLVKFNFTSPRDGSVNGEGEGIHTGGSLGTPDSAGCVRTSDECSEWIYNLVKNEYMTLPIPVQILGHSEKDNPHVNEEIMECSATAKDGSSRRVRVELANSTAEAQVQVMLPDGKWVALTKSVSVNRRFNKVYASFSNTKNPEWSAPENFDVCEIKRDSQRLELKDLNPKSTEKTYTGVFEFGDKDELNEIQHKPGKTCPSWKKTEAQEDRQMIRDANYSNSWKLACTRVELPVITKKAVAVSRSDASSARKTVKPASIAPAVPAKPAKKSVKILGVKIGR